MVDRTVSAASRRRRSTASFGESATKASVYSSPQIIARRNRILDETRKLIGQDGITAISMDEVAKRASVAKRTLYNAFRSKEHMLALAITKYFEDYAGRIGYTKPGGTLAWMIEHLIIVARRNLEIKNYTRVLMNIYFAADVDPEVHKAIDEIASQSHAVWVHKLARQNMLQPWLDADALTDMLVRYRYATAHAWTEGRIPDGRFLHELLVGFLTVMAGATIGAARQEILAALADIDAHLAMNPNQDRRRKGGAV